jgi:hypothetical protein
VRRLRLVDIRLRRRLTDAKRRHLVR